MEQKGKLYYPTIDALRVLAILAVVLIHAATKPLEIAHYDLLHAFWPLFWHQITRFAVPLFFFISGFLLELTYKGDYRQYLQKRLSRIFLPYLTWSAIYYYFVYPWHSESFLNALINGTASYQFYFIPAILLFYLLFPVFHRPYFWLAKPVILLLLGAGELILLYLDYYSHSVTVFYPLAVALFNLFHFISGMVISHCQAQFVNLVKKFRWLLAIASVVLGSWVFLSGRNLYLATGNYLFFYSNWRPQALLYTFSLVPLLYYWLTVSKIPISIIKTLSGLSFFVFFIHVIVLEFFWQNLTHNLAILYFATTACSFALAWLVHKIPYLSRLTG